MAALREDCYVDLDQGHLPLLRGRSSRERLPSSQEIREGLVVLSLSMNTTILSGQQSSWPLSFRITEACRRLALSGPLVSLHPASTNEGDLRRWTSRL